MLGRSGDMAAELNNTDNWLPANDLGSIPSSSHISRKLGLGRHQSTVSNQFNRRARIRICAR